MGLLDGSAVRMDCRANAWKPFALCLLVAASSTVSCQNLNGGHGISGQVGDATLALTMRAIPVMPLQGTNLLSFSAAVVGVSLTPTSGGSINVPVNSSLYQIDFARLQTDTAFLGLATAIPPGSYTNMVVSLANPVVTYCTQTQGLAGCTADSIVTVTSGPATPVISAGPFPLTLVSGQVDGLSIVLNLANALTVDRQTHAISQVNLGAADVATAIRLPSGPSSLPDNMMDFVDDVTGIVSSVDVASQTLTLQTATRGPLTAKAGPSTIVSPNCTAFNLGMAFSCAKEGQVASLDMTLAADGTLRLVEYDPLAVAGGDWVEGVIAQSPMSSTQFQIVANEFVFAPSKTLIGSNLELGAPVTINLTDPKPFVVDSKGLNVPVSDFTGATDASVLQPGETIAVHVVGFKQASGENIASANADFLYLRFTRVAGLVGSVAPPSTFTMQSFPSFFGLSSPVTVQLSNGTPSTNFEGIPDAASLVSEQMVSISAIYFGSATGPTPALTPFCAAKVRVP
jgi:hypothetical protein